MSWSEIFALIAIIAGLLGFTGVLGNFASIGQAFFYIFTVIFIVSLIQRFRGSKPGKKSNTLD
jgi:uncharacterized membrane protein YtjA (UPF0391 family)